MAVLERDVSRVSYLTLARSPLPMMAGEELTAGDPVYVGVDGRVYRAANDTAEHALVLGVVVNGGPDGKVYPGHGVDVAFDGLVAGVIASPGTVVYVGDNPGELTDAPPAGGSGKFRAEVGVMTDAGLFVRPAYPVQV